MNLFLKLPIYDRVILLEYIPNHETFYTLMTMPEFGFLSKNNKLRNRIYESRLKRYFSEYESFYEENISWKEIYNRLVALKKIINIQSKFFLAYNTISYAADGHLMELKILLSKNILPNVVTANNAAYYGHIKILEWMKENNLSLPDQDGANLTAEYGHINVLEWMKENNLLLPDRFGANLTAENGHVNVLEWMKENKLKPPNQNGANWTARNGHINVLNWMKENDLPLPDQYGANWAAEIGRINSLEWMKENNLPLPNRLGANWAATNNHLNVLKWIKENCRNIVWNDTKHYTSNSTILEWLDKQ